MLHYFTFFVFFTAMIKAAESSGFLNLQLMNFQYIPKEVISMKKLKRLRLDCNRNLDLRLGIPEEFKNLTLLSLKSCKLTYIPESIDNLLKIEKQKWDNSQFIEIGQIIEYNERKYKVENVNFKMDSDFNKVDNSVGINIYSPTDVSDYNCQIGVFVSSL